MLSTDFVAQIKHETKIRQHLRFLSKPLFTISPVARKKKKKTGRKEKKKEKKKKDFPGFWHLSELAKKKF